MGRVGRGMFFGFIGLVIGLVLFDTGGILLSVLCFVLGVATYSRQEVIETTASVAATAMNFKDSVKEDLTKVYQEKRNK